VVETFSNLRLTQIGREMDRLAVIHLGRWVQHEFDSANPPCARQLHDSVLLPADGRWLDEEALKEGSGSGRC
jgi:hypothetical protein